MKDKIEIVVCTKCNKIFAAEKGDKKFRLAKPGEYMVGQNVPIITSCNLHK